MLIPRSSGYRRWLSTNSTQTSFELSAGRLLLGATSNGCEVSSGVLRTKGFTSSAFQQMIPLGGYRGIELMPFGDGADNATVAYRLWAVLAQIDKTAPQELPDLSKVKDIELHCLVSDTSAFTLCTLLGTGTDGETLGNTDRIADTMTATLSDTTTTPKGPATLWQTGNGLGTIQVYSPTGNVPASLIIPDCNCIFGIIPEFDLGTATGANFLYRLKR